MAGFDGFTGDTFRFLKGLAKNNNKKWFDANRGTYEEHVLEPAKAFVEALGAKLETISPSIVVDPRVNGTIRRLNRDIRFSKDKTPYKTHLDLMFRNGDSGAECGGSYFLRMFGDRMIVGAGTHEFGKERLKAYRDAVTDGGGESLEPLTRKLVKGGYAVGGQHYKRVPRGYGEEGPHVEFLLYNALHAGKEFKIPTEATSGKFVTFCMGHYRKLAPLYEWMGAI